MSTIAVHGDGKLPLDPGKYGVYRAEIVEAKKFLDKGFIGKLILISNGVES